MPKLIITVCLYDEIKFDTAVNLANVLIKLFHKKQEIYLIVVINSIASFNQNLIITDLNVNLIVLKGDNSNAEFGAWQEGLNFYKRLNNHNQDDKFIFFNDTVFHHFFPNLSGLYKFFNVVSQNNYKSTISGELIHLNKTGAVCGYQVSYFISSALFFVNYSALESLDFHVLNVKTELLNTLKFNNSYELLLTYFDEDILAYKIGQWLFAGYWYKSKKYNDFDKNLLHLKLTMIANEKLLSAKLISTDCNFINSLKGNSALSLFNSIFVSIKKFGLINVTRVFYLYCIYFKRKFLSRF